MSQSNDALEYQLEKELVELYMKGMHSKEEEIKSEGRKIQPPLKAEVSETKQTVISLLEQSNREARTQEVKFAMHQDELNRNGMENYLKDRLSELQHPEGSSDE